MPKVSLVVCLYKERDLLERLLKQSVGCYDDLVVVHDGPEEIFSSDDGKWRIENGGGADAYEAGWKSPEELSLKEPDAPPIEIARDYAELPPDAPIPTGYRLKTGQPVPGSVHEIVEAYEGRFYEGPRCFQQEPHWPFAWWAAKHDWILRLDADEFPSPVLAEWIDQFRANNPDDSEICHYQAIWPLWDGKKRKTTHWPNSRPFLIKKSKHCFFGMVEQTSIPQADVLAISKVLAHQPKRKSYGVRNILFRRQAYLWRRVIAGSLMNCPSKLPRWRCVDSSWPEPWKSKIDHPFRLAFWCMFWFPFCQLRKMLKFERKIDISACLNPGLHHFLLQMAIVWCKIKKFYA
jgi:glycosyltransferase involved in cell wall biosynthesis